MTPVRLTVLGAGSVRCAPAVLASLATYFGERPLDIRLYDADEERLDLFDRFARVCCTIMRSQHAVLATTDLEEAMDGMEVAVLCVGRNCARRFLRRHATWLHDSDWPTWDAAQIVSEAMLAIVPPTVVASCAVLNLVPGEWTDRREGFTQLLDWPPPIRDGDRPKVPHQILRWIRGEEHPGAFLAEHERTPLTSWLDTTIAQIAPSW